MRQDAKITRILTCKIKHIFRGAQKFAAENEKL